MEKIMNFLKENSTFYFATVEGNKPRVRPFGFVMDYEGKLYFGIGKHKTSYKQVLVNPNVEIFTASKDGKWIRIKGIEKTRYEFISSLFIYYLSKTIVFHNAKNSLV
ncbi:TPA: pyridoxamine 5'-phosphate oxidase family protein [Clostridioides difficile]|uniref:pyridoxamine 5'-phosphate oxidase family protein n=2 Tax=Clostridioides difficile TaxID=1496 RepID=UPI000517683F|nr:pyridoxamine 5'-phosphate oxidase family protein [Clostridioides difficile]AXU27867.1 pyridoxamine 5'-phosphate oxidase-like FMN-binding protein [Clostridioides difficile]AXU31664.1 pyridoxamine 5'-phosphate oxidase-like FMN-binding protein [Clostridioides difficile]AXU35452.1 pyridoxamine 5'-phosphate oxidase-like FMN-binding protein [Clostridioides difficile]KJF64515.1 hypothetical protein TZ54_03695 [Clostridioides difficile]MBY1132966.1 pyridoxamine 5'-phosphate oxidase family protein [